MRAKQFTEAALGTSPKREKRQGSRPDRGHETTPRYTTVDEADKHSLIGKYQRGEELYNKVKSTWKDLGDAQKKGDKEAASKAFKKHEKYANLRAPGTFTKVDEIAGAFPSPSTRQKWANDAAASNRAEAARQAELQRQANAAAAAKLAVNTADVDRLNKVNYHGKDAPKPSNATWDGDSDFLDLDGTQYARAMRMPIAGDVPPDLHLVATKEGRQVYLWTRNSLKGNKGHYFYPAEKPNTIQENKMKKQEVTKPRNFVAKNMGAATSGAGAHKDKKKAEKQGDYKHKKQAIPLDEVMAELERQFKEEKAPRALCIGSTPDEDLGASQLASCKSQGLRARDGNKSHKLGKSKKSRVKVGGKKIKGNKYGGPLPDWS